MRSENIETVERAIFSEIYFNFYIEKNKLILNRKYKKWMDFDRKWRIDKLKLFYESLSFL